jgi:hypothetical protein
VLRGIVFFEVVNVAIPEKWQAMKKKGQAETCPYPQKEAKMKTYLYNTTKLYLVKQKAEPMPSSKRPSRQRS